MKTGNVIIIVAIFLLVLVLYLTYLLVHKKQPRSTKNKKVIFLDNMYGYVGALLSSLIMVFTIVKIIIEGEFPAPLWLLAFLWCFYFLGLYLVVYSLRFKVELVKEMFCVTPFIGKSYSFTINDITSIKRQQKNNAKQSERLVILTSKNKLIIESAMTGYYVFLEILKIKL